MELFYKIRYRSIDLKMMVTSIYSVKKVICKLIDMRNGVERSSIRKVHSYLI